VREDPLDDQVPLDPGAGVLPGQEDLGHAALRQTLHERIGPEAPG
jgi:hypothetical protein